jgi:DNA-binding LacI/PurR family transcriptional regulator
VTTRADVAKLAGVSESTVSYVLSGKRPISEATKKRVLAAIYKSGYKSNYAAAALAGGTPRLVTMMISNLFKEPASQIIGTLVEGVVDGVDEAGFHSVIWPVSENADSDIKLLLKTNISGGVILMNVSDNDQRVHLLNSEKVPFVVLGRTNVGFEYNYVDRDFESRDRLALEKLRELGHIEIGVILYGKVVRSHLKKIAKDLKLNLHLISTQNTFEGGFEVARTLKARHPKVTGIISLLDVATLGFVEAAEANGVLIPEEVSLIGLNMLESQAESISPTISTIAYDAYEMAKSCGKLMVEVIAGDKSKPTVGQLWTGEYMSRESVSKARKNID